MVRKTMEKILMLSVFLLVLAGVTLGGRQKRIYVYPNTPGLGGNAPPTEGRHHVIIESYSFLDRIRRQGGSSCGGSLISADWVITARHCGSGTVKAYLNVHPDPLNNITFKVKKHKCKINGTKHDLMLLKLENVHQQWRSQLPTIGLPANPCTAPPINQQVTIYGWMDARIINQTTHEMESIDAGRLRYAKPNVSNCGPFKKRMWWQYYWKKYPLDGHFICFNYTHVASNPGDSGGSLVWNGTLHGVLSWGMDYFEQDNQSGYMNICHQGYRDWIDHTITKP